MKANSQRIKEEFDRLIAIDSESFHERAMADAVKDILRNLGFETEEDDAGKTYGSEAGNVFGLLKGSLPGEPILFSAHMDTVKPGQGKKAIWHEDGHVSSDGTTVLGSDDVAGMVEIFEGVRLALESGRPLRDVKVLLPIAEESYVMGSAVFDENKLSCSEAYVLDLAGRVGRASLSEPSLISFTVSIRGKAAHAGFSPESGINAIAAAASAISRIRQGRPDPESTLNIGTIEGGAATNIVPESCICRGEIRSSSHEKALAYQSEIETIFREEAARIGAECEFQATVHLTAYRISESAPQLQNMLAACSRLGIKPELTTTFGGSDNNTFQKKNIPGITLGCGMYDIHSVREYSTLQDLCMGAELVAALIGV